MAKALWITRSAHCEIRNENLQATDPANHQEKSHPNDIVQVKTLYSGISRGTEKLVFYGRVPESEYTRMRAPFQRGEFSFPVKYGYISVGVVQDGPQDYLNKRVFALYPHQTDYIIPVSAANILPDALPPERALLTANMETAINAIWDAAIKPGDRIAVVGAGVIGFLVAHLSAQIPGCEVHLYDINPKRQVTAKALGLSFFGMQAQRKDYDVIFHTTAANDGLNFALDIAARDGGIMDLSWYGDKSVSLALGGAFHANRLTLRSSQVSTISPRARARWTYSTRMQLAMSLLADSRLQALISTRALFSDLPKHYGDILDNPDTLCHCVVYD